MSEPGDRRVRFEVEVEADVEPITGRITEATGATRDFQGWMALVQAIEDAAASVDRTSDAPTDRRNR